MIRIFKTRQQRQAERISREIVKTNKNITDCDNCIEDSIAFNDVNGKIMYQNQRRKLVDEREELIVKLKNIN